MRVTVHFRRVAGRLVPKHEATHSVTGELYTNKREVEGRSMPVLQLSLPNNGGTMELADFKATYLMGNEIRFVGLEQVEWAWVLQRWDCEIVGSS